MADVDPFPLRFEYNRTRLLFHRQDNSPSGPSKISIRSVRILCQLCVQSMTEDEQRCECLIDTGAPISVFPRKVWTSWPEGTVEWFEPFGENARRAIGVKGIADEVVPARLGRVTISLRSAVPGQPSRVIDTSTFAILAKFMTADSQFDRAVLGIAGNAMDRWRGLDVDFEFEAARLV